MRLYCLRWSNALLIAGYGGIKTTRTYQEDPALHDAVKKLQQVDLQLMARMQSGEIVIDQNTGELTGNLIF